MKVLVVGSGAREAAIIYKLCQSKAVDSLYAFPGNSAWILPEGSKYVGILPAIESQLISSVEDIVLASKQSDIDVIVVGPELYLGQGIVDFGQKQDVFVFGPHFENAKLETSKNYAKQTMMRASIPTASYEFFQASDVNALKAYAKEFWRNNPNSKLVLKVSCLAAGKGVVICENWESLDNALRYLMNEIGVDVDGFVVEEFLEGRECSYFIMCDGYGGFERLGFAVDYKRRFEKDQGPNTGGMGAYTPVNWLPENAADIVDENIVKPLFDYFSKNDLQYRGFLYVGLMWNPHGPKVVEFNVRLGDPEAQVLAVSSNLDWGQYLKSALTSFRKKSFASKKVLASSQPCKNTCSVAVVLSHPDYPSMHAGEIKNRKWSVGDIKQCIVDFQRQQNTAMNLQVFPAGCIPKLDGIYPGKGRVLTIVCDGDSLATARKNVYGFVEFFTNKFWPDAGYRKDVAEFVD